MYLSARQLRPPNHKCSLLRVQSGIDSPLLVYDTELHTDFPQRYPVESETGYLVLSEAEDTV